MDLDYKIVINTSLRIKYIREGIETTGDENHFVCNHSSLEQNQLTSIET